MENDWEYFFYFVRNGFELTMDSLDWTSRATTLFRYGYESNTKLRHRHDLKIIGVKVGQ